MPNAALNCVLKNPAHDEQAAGSDMSVSEDGSGCPGSRRNWIPDVVIDGLVCCRLECSVVMGR